MCPASAPMLLAHQSFFFLSFSFAEETKTNDTIRTPARPGILAIETTSNKDPS